jgi:hypothetical protein
MSFVRRRSATKPRRRAGLLATLAIGLAVSLGAAPVAAQSTAERLIGEWAEAWRGAGRTVDWGGLSRAMGEDRVDLRDVAISWPVAGGAPIRITAPSLSFVGLADRAGGGFTLTRLTAPRLSLATTRDGETIELVLADVDVNDAAIPKFEPPAIDPDRAFTSMLAASRIFDPLAIGRASIGRLSLHGAPADGAEHGDVTVEGLAVAGLSGGRLERLAVGRLVVDAVAISGKARLSIADAEILGADPTVWRRVFGENEAAAGGAEPASFPSLASARTGRIALDTGDATLSIEAMRIGARHVRRLDSSIGRTIDDLLAGREEIGEVDIGRVFLELFLAIRSDGSTFEGVHLSGPDLEHADVKRITVGAFSGESLAELTIESADVVTPKAILRAGRATVAKLRFPDGDDLRRALQAAAVGAEIDPSSLMPTLGHVAVEDLEVGEPGVPSIRLGALRLDLDRYVRAIPTAVSLVLDHFVVPVGLADAEGRKILGDLGYRQLDFSAGLRAAWTEASREVVVEKAMAEVADMGRVELSGRLTGVPPSLFLHPETAPEVFAEIGLAAATATYTDASFAARVLDLLAREEKMKPDRLRRKLVRDVATLFADVRDPARRRRMVEEARRFVTAPKAMTIEARPREPVPIAEILAAQDDLAGLAERLDVTLRTER